MLKVRTNATRRGFTRIDGLLVIAVLHQNAYSFHARQ